MFRGLLTGRWLVVHALFLAASVATWFLAQWQWDRAHEAGGDFQNLGYALQWPLFGLFALFLWYRVVRLDLQHRGKPRGSGIAAGDPPASDTAASDTGSGSAEGESPAPERRPGPLVPPPASPVTADEDPELAAYNRFLAELNEVDRREAR